MAILILGLVLFLGVHSTRILADGWRSAQVAKFGLAGWKWLHRAVALVGMVLVVIGYRSTMIEVAQVNDRFWQMPEQARHFGALLMLLAFILFTAAYVPGNKIKAAVKHPMVLGTLTWALAHLLLKGTASTATLFGAFLVWACLSFLAARRRDGAEKVVYPAGRWVPTLVTVGIGVVLQAAFALRLHELLFGVKLLG